MKEIRIPKGNGKFRTIYVPSEERKKACRSSAEGISEGASKLDVHGVQHGFTNARSPITNAIQHIGYSETLTFDLKDFFDTVSEQHLSAVAFNWTPVHCWHNGHPVQGLPSSPAIANLAAVPMDNDIMALRDGGRFGPLFVYTRYADDLTFSFDLHWVEELLRREIPKIVSKHGFVINPDKTKLQKGSAGRRIITGVAVDHKGVYPTRYHKRKLRAARHQSGFFVINQTDSLFVANPKLKNALNSARGLEEWCKLKLPKNYKPHHEQASENPGTISVTVTQSTHQHQEFHRSFNL